MKMKLKKQNAGFSLVRWIVLTPVVLIIVAIIAVILAIGFYEGRKAYWDNKVREMCEKDGGATVFEKVHISQDEYTRLGGKNGIIPVPSEQSRKDSLYFYRTVAHRVREWNPEVKKRITEIIRSADGKVLGKQITYSRIGGDTPTGITHPSSFSCRDVAGVQLDVERQIFIIEGDTR